MRKNSKFYIGLLILRGFSYNPAKELLRDCKNCEKKRAHFIMSLLPFNTFFDKCFQDLLSTKRVLTELKDNFPEIYAIAWNKGEERRIYPIDLKSEKNLLSSTDILELIKEKGSVIIRESCSKISGKAQVIGFKNGRFYKNSKLTDKDELILYIENLKQDTLIIEFKEEVENKKFPVFHAVYIRLNGETKLSECYISNHAANDRGIELFNSNDNDFNLKLDNPKISDALNLSKKVSDKFSEAPYLNVAISLNDNKIWQIDAGKDLAKRTDYSELTDEFLKAFKRSKKRNFNILIQIKKYMFSLIARKKGFLDYMYKNWLRGLYEDSKLKITTRKEKRWAHKRGFYSYRIKQYSLTEENYKNMLSDYDYKRLRPINGRYQKWLWDKIFMYYVLADFKEYLPKYYCRIMPEKNENLILPFAGNENSFNSADDIFSILQDKKPLVLKPAVGSHGKGFYKLYKDGDRVIINSKAYTKEEFKDFINNLDAVYFISSFIEPHENVKALCKSVASTIRLMVIDDGSGPKIRYSFFRIGRDNSLTDNLDSGGIVAKVDIESGHYYNAEILENHEYIKCDIHPDSKLTLQGDIPHWDLICKETLKIAKYLHPMEYLGFDIVVTQESFVILEINTHQDLHRYNEYPEDVKEYFKNKLNFKNKQKIEICS